MESAVVQSRLSLTSAQDSCGSRSQPSGVPDGHTRMLSTPLAWPALASPDNAGYGGSSTSTQGPRVCVGWLESGPPLLYSAASRASRQCWIRAEHAAETAVGRVRWGGVVTLPDSLHPPSEQGAIVHSQVASGGGAVRRRPRPPAAQSTAGKLGAGCDSSSGRGESFSATSSSDAIRGASSPSSACSQCSRSATQDLVRSSL